jgi:hypothetical protein
MFHEIFSKNMKAIANIIKEVFSEICFRLVIIFVLLMHLICVVVHLKRNYIWRLRKKNMSASHPDQYLNYKINHITNYNLICSGSVSEQENP